jgi:hypothetical protein
MKGRKEGEGGFFFFFFFLPLDQARFGVGVVSEPRRRIFIVEEQKIAE